VTYVARISIRHVHRGNAFYLGGGSLPDRGEAFLVPKTYRLEAEFQNVVDSQRRRLRVGGIHLGTVKYISLPNGPSGKLTVVMEWPAPQEHHPAKFHGHDQDRGFIGDKYVEISFGSEKAPQSRAATIKGETPVDFSDAALAAMNQTKPQPPRLRKMRMP